MTLPSRRDFMLNCGHVGDGASACENFLGRTLEEAERVFEALSPSTEDLTWMGPAAFCFYVEAALNYVRGERSNDALDFVAFLASSLEHPLAADPPAQLMPAVTKIRAGCQYVVDNWQKFEDGSNDYGDVQSRYVELEKRYAELQQMARR